MAAESVKRMKPAPANDDMPVGTIVAFAGPTTVLPTGWLVCDGQPIYQSDYPELCGVIQNYWGDVIPSTGQHILPNLQGMFLRGVNGSKTGFFSDPEYLSRAAHSGRSNDVGSFQRDAFQGHFHAVEVDHQLPKGSGPDNTQGGNERNGFYPNSLRVTQPTQGQHGDPRVAYETRPMNAYVYYIIKATPKR